MAYKMDYEKIAAALQFPTEEIVDVVIDTDAYNEVDDQYAIAWALCSPERIHVEAVYAAPYCTHAIARLMTQPGQEPPRLTREMMGSGIHFAGTPAEGMELSYQEIMRLFSLMGVSPDGRVFRGSTAYIEDTPGRQPVESEAARDLVRRAMDRPEGKRLYVLSIGAITNVASALMMEPAIAGKITVVWLGGQPPYFKNGMEFNLVQDMVSSQHILNCGVPLVLIPCQGVASHLSVTAPELKALLMGRSKVGDYLGQSVLDALKPSSGGPLFMKGYTGGMDDVPVEVCKMYPTKTTAPSRIVWDIATVGYVMNPNWTTSSLTPSPILNDDMTWDHDNSRHPIRLCYYLNRNPIFGDLFEKLASAGK
ncbi:MAG: nucleoside hydrolase [Oscillospiraceae bacterium]|nr:nucleoside hydrolase [Oscillospiraceae bacterium]